METKPFSIRIDSILGGETITSHFGSADQVRALIGIDPSLPIDDSATVTGGWKASGLLRPMGVSNVGTTVGTPMWIIETPKTEETLFVYDSSGSVYTVPGALNAVTGLGDLNDGGSASGNGAAYYDNYVYFARDTTIARYGPLNGTPVFTDDYWVNTLSLTKFEEGDGTGFKSNYPSDYTFSYKYPNHYLHRHSDGKLYIADVVGNQGTLHYIKTTFTTVEGDTNSGSDYNKIQFGYGLWPTCMESYGTDLAVALIEVSASSDTTTFKAMRSKLAFWDTTSTNYNKMTWVEFPDQMITAMKNVNGILYVLCGDQKTQGFRVVKFIGGYSFDDVAVSESGIAPFPGAVDAVMNRFFCGTYTKTPEAMGAIFSKGLTRSALSNGFFNIAGVKGQDASGGYTKSDVIVSALKCVDSSKNKLMYNLPIIGMSGTGDNAKGIAKFGTYGNAPSLMWSQMYRIGQPFKITKIRIPLAQAIAANMTIVPKVYTDDGNGTTYTLQTIDNTYYNGAYNIVLRSDSSGNPILGQHNFWIELRWTGSALCVVGLPITIEGEIIND